MHFSKFLTLSITGSTAWAAKRETIVQRHSEWVIGQTVQTSSGPVYGRAAGNVTQVSAYFGIPYAKPPIDDLRFAPPQKFQGNNTINGTDFGLSCPISTNFGRGIPPNFTNSNLTKAGEGLVDYLFQTGDEFSEDCLTLNVWTKPQVGEKKKAVLIYIMGGGWSVGTTNDRYGDDGVNIAAEEDVVVVSLNYRLNIFGFPGNPNAPNNLGILDQRLAIEWVRDNIAAFGGDPGRIILFGQSTGAGSIDIYSFAYTSDPIIAGVILQSGSVGLGQYPKNLSSVFWYNVTSTLGCGNSTSNQTEVLACMKKKKMEDVQAAIPFENVAGGFAAFWPTVDDEIIFSDYPARSATGQFIKVPMLIGNTHYEAGFYKAVATIYGTPAPDSFWESFNLMVFTCPSANRANISISFGIPTWRYRYFGNFPDHQLQFDPDSGAYHGSELGVLFGTFLQRLKGGPPVTNAEIAIGKYLRGAWGAFAKNPRRGLDEYEEGWPQWEPGKETLIRLGYENRAGTNVALPALYDTCDSTS